MSLVTLQLPMRSWCSSSGISCEICHLMACPGVGHAVGSSSLSLAEIFEEGRLSKDWPGSLILQPDIHLCGQHYARGLTTASIISCPVSASCGGVDMQKACHLEPREHACASSRAMCAMTMHPIWKLSVAQLNDGSHT